MDNLYVPSGSARFSTYPVPLFCREFRPLSSPVNNLLSEKVYQYQIKSLNIMYRSAIS